MSLLLILCSLLFILIFFVTLPNNLFENRMKLRHIYYLLFVVATLFSCTGENSIGVEIQPQEDKINFRVDTIHLSSRDTIISAISAQCSDTMSMVLGEYFSQKYGYVKADMLLQFAAPIGYKFPEASYNKEVDSLVLMMYYNSYFGQGNEPFEISVYELNKATPDFYTQYLTDFDVNKFLDKNIQQFRTKKLITTVNQALTQEELDKASKLRKIQINFSKEEAQRFFSFPESAYSSQSEFQKYFKGLYLTTTYGKSTVIYPFEVDLFLYYHYSYQTKNKAGQDTTIKVSTKIAYPASKDVRQLVSIKRQGLVDKVNTIDSINFVTTAAGVYPRINLPVKRIKDIIKQNLPDKDLRREVFISSANISVEATEVDLSKTAVPVPSALYALPASEIDQFLKTYSVKQYKEHKAQIAIYNQKTKEYTIDMSFVLNKLLKSDESKEYEEFLLVPIDMYYDVKGNAVEFKATKRIGAATLRSGKSAYSPLRMELVYSGF